MKGRAAGDGGGGIEKVEVEKEESEKSSEKRVFSLSLVFSPSFSSLFLPLLLLCLAWRLGEKNTAHL